MNLTYLIPPLLSAIIAAILLVVVVIKSRRNAASKLFSLIVFNTFLWGLLIFFMRNSPDAEWALMWDRMLGPFLFAPFILFYHFSKLITTGVENKKAIVIAYCTLIPIIVLSPTDYLIETVEETSYGYAPQVGPVAYYGFAVGLALMVMAIVQLIRTYRASKEYEERNRLLLVTLAMVFPLVGLLLEVFPTIYPTGIFGALAFCLLTSIAIFKYRLFDVRTALRKSLRYLAVSGFVAVPYVTVIYLVTGPLKPEGNSTWVHILLVLALAIAIQPLWRVAQGVVDRALYRGRYDLLKTLERFSSECTEIINLSKLADRLILITTAAMNANGAYLIIFNETELKYTVIPTSSNQNEIAFTIDADSALVTWFQKHDQPLRRSDIDYSSELASVTATEKGILETTQADLLVPFKRGADLIGLLIMGGKLSGEPYGAEDEMLLMVLARQAGVALENASLYEHAVESQNKLKRYQEDLRKMVTRLEQAEEMERERLARELHDQVGQNLAALGFNLNLIKNQLASAAETVQMRIKESLDLLEQTASSIRTVMMDLRPPMLDDYGLVAALRWQGERLASQTDIEVEVVGKDLDPRPPERMETGLFRITQEALTNVMKHAESSQVIITIDQSNGSLKLTIADDGIGFDLYGYNGTNRFSQYGLLSMTERAQSFNGKLHIDSEPGTGTCITVEVPVNEY